MSSLQNIQLPNQPLFLSQEEKELLEQPSVFWPTGSSAKSQPNWFELANDSTLPDDYGLSHLAFPMAAKVDQFAKTASSRGYIGANVRDEGIQTYFQLQQSSKNAQEKKASYQLLRTQERRDTQQLKTTISESSLKKTTSFADRKKKEEVLTSLGMQSVMRLNEPDIQYPQQAAKCVGSREILQFKKNDHRPKLLVLTSRWDGNGAFNPSHKRNCEILKAMDTEYNLKYAVISRVDEIFTQLRQIPENSLSGMVIQAHGSPLTMDFGSLWNGEISDVKATLSFKNRSFIILDSCLTGMLERISPLFKLRDSLNLTGKRIILSAPKTSNYSSLTEVAIWPSGQMTFRFFTTDRLCKKNEDTFPGLLKCSDLPMVNSSGFYDSTKTIITDGKRSSVK